jgi:hypothetical protein
LMSCWARIALWSFGEGRFDVISVIAWRCSQVVPMMERICLVSGC